MQGNVKDKIKIGLIVAATLVAVTLLVSIISGRVSTADIIVVKKDGLDINVPLNEQLEFFETKEIAKSEFKTFQDSVVTDFSQLTNVKINHELSVGSPIPLGMLVAANSAGRFAAGLEEGSTIHLFPSAAASLPPVEQGDKINVGLIFDEENDLGKNIKKSSILLYDLEIATIIEGDLYVKVNLDQSLALQTSSKLGEFFFQLPGQLELPFCSELENKKSDDIADSEENESDEITDNEEDINEPDEVSTKEDDSVDDEKVVKNCLPDDYLPSSYSTEDILSFVSDGKALNLSDRELSKHIKELGNRIDELETNSEKEDDSDADTNDNDSDVADINTISGSCNIKVDESTMVYFMEGQDGYDQIDSNLTFCSPEEAEDFGYSPAI